GEGQRLEIDGRSLHCREAHRQQAQYGSQTACGECHHDGSWISVHPFWPSGRKKNISTASSRFRYFLPLIGPSTNNASSRASPSVPVFVTTATVRTPWTGW